MSIVIWQFLELGKSELLGWGPILLDFLDAPESHEPSQRGA